MAFTVGDIVSKVQRRVRDTGYSATEVIDYLNDTQRDIFNEYRLPFMQTSQNYTLAANVSDVTNGLGLPTNFSEAVDLALTSAGREKMLRYMSYQEVNQLFPDPSDTTVHPASVPDLWYKYGNTIRVYPTPNDAYTLTLYYIKSPTLLDSNDDVPEVPEAFEEILVMGAAYRIMQVKDNYDIAAVLQNKYMELLDKLASRTSQGQAGHATRMRINRFASRQ